jgi:hypothetical protein
MLAKHPLRQRFAMKVVSHGLPRFVGKYL